MNIFYKSEKDISPEILAEVEKFMNVQIPQELREHYLEYNGGKPERNCWWQDDFIYFEIAKFKPIRYVNNEVNQEKYATLENNYFNRITENVLPKEYVPFAYDHGNNYFCINTKTEDICIIFMDLGNPIENPDSIRILTNGFKNFIENLEESEDFDFD